MKIQFKPFLLILLFNSSRIIVSEKRTSYVDAGPRNRSWGAGRPEAWSASKRKASAEGAAASRQRPPRWGPEPAPRRQGGAQAGAGCCRPAGDRPSEKGACRRGWPEQLQDEQVSTATSQNLQSLRRRLPEAPFRGSPWLHSLQPGSGDRYLPGLFKPVMKNKISDIETVRWQLLASSL